MKIAYISLHWPRFTSSSIGKKISLQVQSWRNFGHEVKFFSHMHATKNQQSLMEGSYFIFEQKKGGLGFLKTELSRIQAAKKLLEAVKADSPDLIYMRWAMYVFPIHRLSQIAPVVLEINTNDIQEHKLLGPWMNAYNLLTRHLTLANADGMVFTTRELSQIDSFSRFKSPYVIVPNGIDVNGAPFYAAPNNPTPHLIFIGTPGMTWQGVDKLVQFAHQFPDIYIDLVGFDQIDAPEAPPNHIALHGFIEGQEYENVLSTADAAIGTLALYRKGMKEASPLKIRDCLARGIPCILPYRDTAVGNLNINEILPIPNTPDNISKYGKKIHDFVYAMRGKRVHRDIIREKISSETLERKRLDFFEQMLHKRHSMN